MLCRVCTICPSPRTDISSSLSHLPLAGVVQWQLFLYCHLPEGLGLFWGISTGLSPGPRALQVLRAFPLLSCFHVSSLMLLQGAAAASAASAGSGSSAGEFCLYFAPLAKQSCLSQASEVTNSLSARLGTGRCAPASPGSMGAAHLAGCTRWGGVPGEAQGRGTHGHCRVNAHCQISGISSLIALPWEAQEGISPWALQGYCPGAAHTPWIPKPVCLW